MESLQQFANWAGIILPGLLTVLLTAGKVIHEMGYEWTPLTRLTDIVAAVAQWFANRPMVAIRRAQRA